MNSTIETPIPGLYVIRNVINLNLQKELIHHIINSNKFEGLTFDLFNTNITSAQGLDFETINNNQSISFDFQLPSSIQNIIELNEIKYCLNKLGLINENNNNNKIDYFNQVIYNLYLPGQGILPHIDLLKFEEIILGISLLSSVNFDFYQPKFTNNLPTYLNELNNKEDNLKLTLRLNPGDIYILSDQVRYHWYHGIEFNEVDEVDGNFIKRELRCSITLRRCYGDHKDNEILIKDKY